MFVTALVKYGIQHKVTTAYHLQTSGKARLFIENFRKNGES